MQKKDVKPVESETSTIEQPIEVVPDDGVLAKLDTLIDITSELAKRVDENATKIRSIQNGGEVDFRATESTAEVSDLDSKLPSWLREMKNDILGKDVALILNDKDVTGGSTFVIPERLSLVRNPMMDIVDKKPVQMVDENGKKKFYPDKRSNAVITEFTSRSEWEKWMRKIKKHILRTFEANQEMAPTFNVE